MVPFAKSTSCSNACGCCGVAAGETDAPRFGWSRRRFVATSIIGVAGALTAAGADVATLSSAGAQSSLSPDAALQELLDGNRRFTEGNLRSFDEDFKILKEKTAETQEPFAAILSCADSRVPVELLFDQSIGHVFVARVAGNIASSDIIASLEYGVAVLGTKAIVVLGHGNCGAVKAAIGANAVPGQISALYRYIRPAVDRAGPNLEAAIKANAQIQAGLLRDASPVIAEAVRGGRVKVVAGFYDLGSGKVNLID
jgi:carbonic anhydrase